MTAAARDFTMVFVMAANEDEAQRIAQVLVAERLAVCVNIAGPVRSIYRWRGKIEHAGEYMLVIKTAKRQFFKLERKVRELHSYEVPEIIAVTLVQGSKPYIAWLAESTRLEMAPAPARSRRRSIRT